MTRDEKIAEFAGTWQVCVWRKLLAAHEAQLRPIVSPGEDGSSSTDIRFRMKLQRTG